MTSPLELPLADADRTRYVGSTDIRYIANGEVADLYRIKVGEIAEPNLDHVWKVQLGKLTEGLHARWHAKLTHLEAPVQIVGQRVPLADRKLPGFVAASFDYWLAQPGQVLELKHTNARSSHRECASFYMAQLQWQMLVTDAPGMRFSIILGNEEPIWGEVEADHVLQEMLLDKGEAFMAAVEAGEPPLGGADPAITAAVAEVKIDGKRAYDWRRNNAWVAGERGFLVGRAFSAIGKLEEDKLKSLVPADASEVTGQAVSYKRDKRGALRVSIDDDALAEQLSGLARNSFDNIAAVEPVDAQPG